MIWQTFTYHRAGFSEILYGLLAPFRADPLAVSVVRPWVYLADAIQRAVLPLGEVQWLWTASRGNTGPLGCAKVALPRAGVTADAGLTRLRSNVGDFTLWAGPTRPLQDFLLLALRSHQLRRLSKLRPLVQAISEGIDRTATLAYLWSPQVLMTGGAVTQAVAAKWVPGGKCARIASLLMKP